MGFNSGFKGLNIFRSTSTPDFNLLAQAAHYLRDPVHCFTCIRPLRMKGIRSSEISYSHKTAVSVLKEQNPKSRRCEYPKTPKVIN